MATDIRPNFYNLQNLDVQDLSQEHDYLVSKIEDATNALSIQGTTSVKGLEVTEDSVVIESFAFPQTAYDATRPDLENFLVLPPQDGRTLSSRLYTVFQSSSNNIQRLDLKLEANIVTSSSFVTISIMNLKNATNPMSGLGEEILTRKIYKITEIPVVGSNTPLILDFSGNNDRGGIPTIVNNYYAIVIEFSRETASLDTISVFHSDPIQTSTLNPQLYSWIYFGTKFQQGIFTSQAILKTFTLYHKVYTAAVQIGIGSSLVNGKPIRVHSPIRWLGLVDRGATNPTNYVVLVYNEIVNATESAARTGNLSASRLQDSYFAYVLNTGQYNDLVSNPENIFILLATIEDQNIQSFQTTKTFTLENVKSLAYHDWLVPSNTKPSLAALGVQQLRPNDMVFIADNVPFEIPLTDYKGNLAVSADGNPITDQIVEVYLDLYFNGGNNKQSLQMSIVRETPSSPSYRTFAATITDPATTNAEILSYTYPYDLKQLTDDVFYNFRAVTAVGNEVFIQDYDRVFGTKDVNGKIIPIRSQQYSTVLEKDALVIEIDKDLHLGESSFSSGAAGQELVGYKTYFQNNELTTPVGSLTGQSVIPRTDTVLPYNQWQFGPLPVVTRDGTDITNTDSSVMEAYSKGDISIRVDGIDISFSGTTSPDKGGRGSPTTIFGELIFPNSSTYIGAVVKLRNADGKDNTQQSTNYLVTQDPISSRIEFTAIGLGRGLDLDAGFSHGENIYIYIDDRPALDANGSPITIVYNEFTAVAAKIWSLGSKRYFTGKTIVSAGDHIVYNNVQLNPNEVAIDPINGHLYFAPGETPSGTITIQFLQLNSSVGKIDYYQTRLTPWGTVAGTPLSNTDSAVQTAVASGDLVIKFGGKDIRELNCTPNGPVKVFADTDQYQLQDYEISVNPLTGRIVFHSSFTVPIISQGNIPLLTSSTPVEVSYYQIIPQTITTVNQLYATYETRFDLNSDGKIDENDLAIFSLGYGSVIGQPNYDSNLDFNADGKIDDQDYQELVRHFGTTSQGSPIYLDSTAARLNSVFAFQTNTPSNKLEIIRAVTQPATNDSEGKTLLFISEKTPVTAKNSYTVAFGFSEVISPASNQFTVQTETSFELPINYSSIRGYNIIAPTETYSVYDSNSSVSTDGAVRVFHTTFSFSPPVRTSKTLSFSSLWEGSNLKVFSRRKTVSPLEYETLQRRIQGPFDIVLGGTKFAADGSYIELAIGSRDSISATGETVNTGQLIHGISIQGMKFKVLLNVVNEDGINYTEWVWENLSVDSNTGLIRLQYSQALRVSDRNKGRNGTTVLNPFGVAPDQIALKPQFANGDIANDLSNILVYRENYSENIAPHAHSSQDDGGLLLTDNIVVNNLCGFEGLQPRLTQVLCQIKRDSIKNLMIGDFGNESVVVKKTSIGYGGDQLPIRIPTKVGDTCFQACGPIVSLSPCKKYSTGAYYPHDTCDTVDCIAQMKIGQVSCGFFEVEYHIDPCFEGDVTLNFNWSACGYVCSCPVEPPLPPLIGQAIALQQCQYNFEASIQCLQANGLPLAGEPAYYWDLGDGNTRTERAFRYTYQNPGTYKVSLVTTCPDGRIFTEQLVIVTN